jgi:hypothetical protein
MANSYGYSCAGQPGRYIIASGGDDNALYVASIARDEDGRFHTLAEATIPDAHASSVKGVVAGTLMKHMRSSTIEAAARRHPILDPPPLHPPPLTLCQAFASLTAVRGSHPSEQTSG